ncbi:zinc knuckle CX2CX4HX4C containing protein [Tanacetum coccineum]
MCIITSRPWTRVSVQAPFRGVTDWYPEPSSNTSMKAMLESGVWLIRNVSLILRKWTPMENVSKEDIKSVLVLVELYDVPITAFTHDGLSVIATNLAPLNFQFKSSKQVYQPTSIKNGASTSCTKKNADRRETTTSNHVKSSKDKEVNESNVASTSRNMVTRTNQFDGLSSLDVEYDATSQKEDLQNKDGVDSNIGD